MRFLRSNTATRIGIGPFLDKTDGVTPEVALTVTSCKLTMTVDDGGVPTLVLDTAPTASGGANDMVHITGDDAGMFDLELAAANVNYLGRAKVIVTDAATHCPVWEDFMILPAMIYDSLVLGTDRFDVNVTHVADSDKLSAHVAAVLKGLTTSGSSTTAVIANATTGIDGGVPSATNDFYNGRVMIFTSGALAGQATAITDYVGSTQTFTVTALTGAPASGVTFVIV